MCGLLLFLCCQYKCWLLHMNLPRAKARGFHELPEEARVVAVSSTGRLTGNLAAGSFCQLAQKDLLPDGRQPPQGSARTTAFRPGPQKRHRLVTLPKPGAVDSFAETLFVVLSHLTRAFRSAAAVLYSW